MYIYICILPQCPSWVMVLSALHACRPWAHGVHGFCGGKELGGCEAPATPWTYTHKPHPGG